LLSAREDGNGFGRPALNLTLLKTEAARAKAQAATIVQCSGAAVNQRFMMVMF
jgi:hypothetical protein